MKCKLFSTAGSCMHKAFVVAAGVFVFNTGFSQVVMPGVRTSFNVSNWNLSGVSGVEPLSSVTAGATVFATLPFSRSFSIEPGVSFARLGATLKYTDIEKIASSLTCLQIPVVARYEFRNRITLFAGPQCGFLLKATMRENGGEKQNAKKVFKKNDVAIVSGVEYYFLAGIGIRANYTAGLTDIYAQGPEKITNYSYGISVAYRFNVAKRTARAKK